MNIKLFDPFGNVKRTQGLRLPHWEQPGACYFLTFRLADSVPRKLWSQWQSDRKDWLAAHPPPHDPATEQEYHRRFSTQIDRWIDAGYGSCHLRDPTIRGVVAGALNFFDHTRYVQHSFVIMPNHCHCLVSLNPENPLGTVVKTWKGYSANQINELLQRTGALWYVDYFDRLVRDSQHFANCVRYIRRNPAKARLNPGEYTIYESDLARQIPDRRIE